MTDTIHFEGIAAPLLTPNLDTDQIMPKQFLRGIDKAGLDKGLLYDLRYDAGHQLRPEFVLNQPAYHDTAILVAGSNFGCGSSREHAVWGLQQYGIRAVIASSYGEIFYSNAMNNRLLLVMLPEEVVQQIMADVGNPQTSKVTIDVQTMTVTSHSVSAPFSMSERHRHMFMEELDQIGATLAMASQITAFRQRHWEQRPWLKEVAYATKARLKRPWFLRSPFM
ncbi:3-isopropylmalate dehydratase small subunit [Duganella sp. FT92W]|uniref:3-isopropylmalate dehydratase small subunit n=1 Tax=Pseudoduganella rivuli TaxID=2666085 RepID=A0A7X2ILD6_9BURK|nr:3-isopropylmalate dehydratase small subunit [Pseudoduganella rivuli]MRV71981.1 3-isopropylmalate dehydratase small subunit [Pseudoduganella rivuli]